MQSGRSLPAGELLHRRCVFWNREERGVLIKFLLWCVLFILCWPVALLALVLYPLVWVLLLPFRLLGIAVHGVLELVAALLFLPARLLRAI